MALLTGREHLPQMASGVFERTLADVLPIYQRPKVDGFEETYDSKNFDGVFVRRRPRYYGG